jgi:dipeptidyl-peptidase-4
MARLCRHCLKFSVVRSWHFLLLALGSTALLAQAPEGPPPSKVVSNDISVGDVCDAVLPSYSQDSQFEWIPDGSGIAYFKTAGQYFGLQTELDLVNAGGTERSTLLTAQQIDKLFPARVFGPKEERIPPPRVSLGFNWGPDGSGILLYDDRDIYWLDRKTGQTRQVLTGKTKLGDVQLSPNGHWASFVRDHNLWVVSIAGGPERAITHGGSETLLKGELDWMYPVELGTKHGYAWSPDSSRIAYLEFDLKNVAAYTPPFLAADETRTLIDYPTPGRPNPVMAAYVARLAEKSPIVAIRTGDDKDVYLPRLQWLPDSQRVAIQRMNRSQNQLDLLIADASTGTSKVLLTDKDDYWINLSDILYFFKDSPQLIWSSERSGYRHLYLYGLDGKLIKQLTDGKWDVTSLNTVNEAKRTIFFTSTQKTSLERQVYSLSLDGTSNGTLGGGEAKPVSFETGTHEVKFSPDDSTYVDYFSTSSKPWTRLVYRLSDGMSPRPYAKKLFALEEPPAAPEKKPPLRPIDMFTMKTHDGVELNASIIRPTGFMPTKKYPAILYIAGGPGLQAVHEAWDGDVTMFQQVLAQHGFVVLSVDNRGTGGRGHLFEEYIHYRFESQELSDQRDAVHFLQTLPYIDGTRIGIWGRGYGGALVVNLMMHRPLVVKAGFAVAPIVDWFQYDSAFTERYLGDPVKNLDGYLSSSPLESVHAFKGPFFVAHGTSDLQSHPEQTMELQHELVDAHKYAEISLFPGEGHRIAGNSACSVMYQHATDFFVKGL